MQQKLNMMSTVWVQLTLSWEAAVGKPCNRFCSSFKSLLSHSIYKTRNYYIGEYKDGDRHGQGTYWWANGYKYVGEWKEGNYHGKGTEYTADGQISREGVWEEGKYVGNG